MAFTGTFHLRTTSAPKMYKPVLTFTARSNGLRLSYRTVSAFPAPFSELVWTLVLKDRENGKPGRMSRDLWVSIGDRFGIGPLEAELWGSEIVERLQNSTRLIGIGLLNEVSVPELELLVRDARFELP